MKFESILEALPFALKILSDALALDNFGAMNCRWTMLLQAGNSIAGVILW
jgi:hypothetical protein